MNYKYASIYLVLKYHLLQFLHECELNSLKSIILAR